MPLIDIADLDCIFLTYDEPNKEQNWIKIQNMVPWAKRVDGVKGSDTAHKSAAALSETDRFVLIDGDNIPDSNFFNLTLSLDSTTHNKVFRWKARNEINGLMYGNGGLKMWSTEHLTNMKSHELADEERDAVDFCWDFNRYKELPGCWSNVYTNASAYQAFRVGFREGVKMSLDQGAKVDDLKKTWWQNYQRLLVWCNVGADVEAERIGNSLAEQADE